MSQPWEMISNSSLAISACLSHGKRSIGKRIFFCDRGCERPLLVGRLGVTSLAYLLTDKTSVDKQPPPVDYQMEPARALSWTWTWQCGCGALALRQYEAAFRENAITEKLLPSLTAEDLKDLGVSIVGHRRALLNAIADLRSDTSTERAPSAAHATAAMPVKDTTAERRQVTVMFSDLVGSTALSARIDPEDLREVISAYQKCVAETVRRFDGFVAKFMGDGVLVYFGYPQAHEDDAERAVRAGLELVAAVGGIEDPRAPADARRHCNRVSWLSAT